jgi:hypothetical protein
MHVNAKMILVETVPGIREGGMGERSGGGNSSMIYLIHCKSLVNATMYPHPAQQLKKKTEKFETT